MLIKRQFEPRVAHVILLILVTFCFYSRSLDNYWVKDDLNLHLMTEEGTDQIAWKKYRAFLWPDHMTHDQYWRPLPVVTGFVDYAQWGTDPTGYHIFNTMLHALVGVLVYFLFNRLTNFRNSNIGFMAGLAVVLNPISPEAVIWITQRMVLMCSMFYLLALLSWLKGIETGLRRWRIVAWSLMLCSMMSKEVGATLPACFFLMDMVYGSQKTGLKQRALNAARLAIPSAAMLGGYLACRFLLFGRAVSITYSQLEPAEYARQFQVFERMGQSVYKSLFPINEAVFSDTATTILAVIIGAGYSLALFRGCLLVRRNPNFNHLAALCGVLLFVSFAPTLMIFWVDNQLFNGRFFYQPSIAILGLIMGALWLPMRPVTTGTHPRGTVDRLLSSAGSLLILLPFAVSLAGGLSAFDKASHQIRGLQRTIGSYAAKETKDGFDPVVVALMTPSSVEGVPTLEYLLRQLMQPPLHFPAVSTIPLVDVHYNTERWYRELKDHVERENIAPERLRYVQCLTDPVGIRPIFADPDPPQGVQPPSPLAPSHNAFLSNLSPAPVFRFRRRGDCEKFRVRFLMERPALDHRLELKVGTNCTLEGDVVTWKASDGDAAQPGAPDLWTFLVRQHHAQPLAIVWRIEAFDREGGLAGVSEERHLFIFNVIPEAGE